MMTVLKGWFPSLISAQASGALVGGPVMAEAIGDAFLVLAGAATVAVAALLALPETPLRAERPAPLGVDG